MILDFIIYNTRGILLFSVLLNIFCFNEKRFFILLIIDILLNKIPFVTLLIILIFYLNKEIFKIIRNNFFNQYLILILYYFIFGIAFYSIFNTFNYYIIKLLIENLIFNLIIYYFGLKYVLKKYNLMVNI